MHRNPPLAAGQLDAEHRMAELGDLDLESGEILHDYRQSYVTHGKLNREKSNAVLVCISLTGNHHRLDFLIGPGKALDPAQYFIIAADSISNGLSTSPSNSEHQPGMRFPRFTIRDMVESQHRFLNRQFGIPCLHAVIGASMGGMQALQWAVSHPQFMSHCVAMTPMAKTSPWAVLVTETARSCLMADPAWTGDGFSAEPLRGWRAYTGLMTALMSRTPSALAEFLPDCAEAHLWFEKIHAQHRTAHADGESSDIVGKWAWTRAENACTEVYDYRPDGTLYVESGTEKTDNTYAMDSSADQNGFFRMILKIVKDYGGKDCADSDEDSTGQENTVYVLFHSSRAIHAVCRDPNLDACYGPLKRIKE